MFKLGVGRFENSFQVCDGPVGSISSAAGPAGRGLLPDTFSLFTQRRGSRRRLFSFKLEEAKHRRQLQVPDFPRGFS
eukprot:9484989-Pyramimonas_sp.AAC.1